MEGWRLGEIAGKGRGLVALRDFHAGDVVLSEQPFVCTALNTLPNFVLCIHCLRCISFPLEVPRAALELHRSFLPCKDIPCALSCNRVFCSEECRQKQGVAHQILCPADSPEMTKLMSLEAWQSARFRLFCNAVAAVISTMIETRSDAPSWSCMEDFVVPLSVKPAGASATALEERMREPISLLKGHISKWISRWYATNSAEAPDPADILSPVDESLFVQWWAGCAANAQPVHIPSPLQSLLCSVIASGREDAPQLVGKCMSACSDAASDSIQGSGMFRWLSKLNHDCDPNLSILSARPDQGASAQAVARKEIAAGEELTISYISNVHDAAGSDPAAPAGEQAMLSSRSESRSRWCDLEESHELYQRYAFHCQCALCLSSAAPTESAGACLPEPARGQPGPHSPDADRDRDALAAGGAPA